jgi:hypothetical protein
MSDQHDETVTQSRATKREVPVALPLSVVAFLLIASAILYLVNPMSLQLALAFPMGLPICFFDHIQIKNDAARSALAVPLMFGSYAVYLLLLALMLLARKWRTFSLALLLILCVSLVNIAGCHSLLQSLSDIH